MAKCEAAADARDAVGAGAARQARDDVGDSGLEAVHTALMEYVGSGSSADAKGREMFSVAHLVNVFDPHVFQQARGHPNRFAMVLVFTFSCVCHVCPLDAHRSDQNHWLGGLPL